MFLMFALADAPASSVALNDFTPVTGAEAWSGPSDASGTVTISFTPKAVLVAMSIRDDHLRCDKNRGHQSDSIECYFDLRPTPEFGDAQYTRGVFQLIITPDFTTGLHGIAFNNSLQNYDPDVPGTIVHCVPSTDGYEIRAELPVEGLAQHHFAPGDRIAVAFGINDDDGSGKETQLFTAGTKNNWRDATGWDVIPVAKNAD